MRKGFKIQLLVCDILIIMGAVWFIGIIPLTLLSVSDRFDSSRVGFLGSVLWGLTGGGVLLSPILMLVGGFWGRSLGSEWANLGIAGGIIALIICLPIAIGWGSTLFDNPAVERGANAILVLPITLLGLASLAIGIAALIDSDVGFGVGSVAMGIALTVDGVAVIKAMLRENDRTFDWFEGSGMTLLGSALLVLGISMGLFGVYMGFKRYDWILVAASVVVGARFAYRGTKLLRLSRCHPPS